jgi:hypothetical protein
VPEEQRVNQIKAQFAREGYELAVHPVAHGGYFAPYMRVDSQGGVAPLTGIEPAQAFQPGRRLLRDHDFGRGRAPLAGLPVAVAGASDSDRP